MKYKIFLLCLVFTQGVWAQNIVGDVQQLFVDSILVLNGNASANDREISWNTDGGQIVFGAGTNYIQVKWATAGEKNITLTFKDANGTSRTSSTYKVKVYDLPLIDPIAAITLGEWETWSTVKARELPSLPTYTDANSPTIVREAYYTLDGQKLEDDRVFTYEDHGKVLRYELNTVCGAVYNTGEAVEVNILPTIQELTDINAQYSVNDQLSTTVTVIENGCDIRGYKWYVDDVLKWDDDTNDTNTSTFVYTVSAADHNKKIKVEVVTDYGSVFTTKKLRTLGTLITDINPSLPEISPTPAGFALREPEYRDLPDNYWENEKYAFFTRNDVDYTDGETVYLSQGGSGWYVDPASGEYEATVKYLPTGIFDISNLPINPVAGTSYNTRDGYVTIFLDTNTEFEVVQPHALVAARAGLKYIGCGDIGSVVLYYEEAHVPQVKDKHSLQIFAPNTVIENIVFDSRGSEWLNHFLYINDSENPTSNARSDNFIMKDVTFKNIVQQGYYNTKGLISIDDSNGYYVEQNASGWNATAQSYFTTADKITTRYFINVTIDESCTLKAGSFTAAGVLLNSSRHVYFENLKVNTTMSVPVWAMRSNTSPISQASTMVPGGLIFNGMQNTQDRLSFQLMEGRDIQVFKEDYRWAEYKKSDGFASSITNTALSLYRDLPSPASGLAYYDRQDGYWIIRDGASRTIKQQLEDLRDVYKHANGTITSTSSILYGQNRADLPPLNIKLIVGPTREIGALDIPDFGDNIPVNIVPVESVDDLIYQGDDHFVFNPATSVINFPVNGKNIKIYNVDFVSSAEYFLQDVTIETTFANAVPGNFYNCKFKTYIEGEEELIIKIRTVTPEDPITAGFTGNSAVCEEGEGSLGVSFEGTGPWELSYKKAGDAQSTTITVSRSDLVNGVYQLTGLPLNEDGSSTQYLLTGVSQGGQSGTVYNSPAYIDVVKRPEVKPIEGASEVLVNNSIQLTNKTIGGKWLVSDATIASITNRGELTGLKAGTVEVWYVVQNDEMPSCETIVTHTVTVKTSGGGGDGDDDDDDDDDDTDPDEDPEPEWPDLPEEPDPNPDGWIVIQHPLEACYTDEFFNISFRLHYTDKSLKYAIAFTEKSKAAGFQDIKTLAAVPKDGIITVPVPAGVKPGTYTGYILLLEKGATEYKPYPFSLTIKGGVEIIKHPQSITQLRDGEKFVLSVEAKGDNLRYQWFYNGQKIEGATSATYEGIYSGDKEGLYYVEVYGDCDEAVSDEALITGCFSALLNKWHDVLYIEDIEGKYVRFQWYKNGQAIETDGTAIYYPEDGCLNGVYAVRAYRADGSYDITCDVPIFVTVPALEIHIKWNDVLFVYNWNDQYNRFQWFRDGQMIADDKTPYYNTDGVGGTYFVRAYKKDGTSEDSPSIDYKKVYSRAAVSVYPTIVDRNHSVNVESMEIGTEYIGGIVDIYNLSGVKIYSRRMDSSHLEIPMVYNAGAYILQVTMPDGRRKTEKVIVR